MSHSRTTSSLITVVLAACLVMSLAMSATAAPYAAQTSADREAVERAVERYKTAQDRAADIEARMTKASTQLDSAIANERQARGKLRSRVLATYRADDAGFVSVLLSASTFSEFVARWDLLARIVRRDAETLADLKAARIEAQDAAEKLIDLQADQARAIDSMASEVASAKKELATSVAALQEYEAQTAAKPKPLVAPPPRDDQPQEITGSGSWQTAVASHYGRNFSGRGASGEEIGSYSMIVAHRTLPFGTLIEFEYNGRRAVARVADRGPHVEGREFDLGPGVVRTLDFSGVHEVRYRIISQ